MAWNPLSLFKNNSISLRKSKTSTPTTTPATANTDTDTTTGASMGTSTGTGTTAGTTTGDTQVITDSLNFKPSGSLLYDITRAYSQGAKEKAGQDFAEVATQNQQNAFETDDFSLDPYNISSDPEGDNPIDGTVKSEEKLTWGDAVRNAFEITGVRKTGNIFKDVAGGWEVLWSAAEQKFPSFGELTLTQSTKKAFGGNLEYKAPTGLTYKYNGTAPIDFENDIWGYLQAEDLYNMGAFGKHALETLGDELYEKYKNDFRQRGNMNAQAIRDSFDNVEPDSEIDWRGQISIKSPEIRKDVFLDFIENERNKTEFKASEFERKGIDTEEARASKSRISQGVQYIINKVGPEVENSTLKTTDIRKEFMNDVFAASQSLIGRWDSAMTQTYRTKVWLQDLYNVDDIYTIDRSIMKPEHLEILNSIEINERNYNQFVKNLAKYISLLPSYADPETGKLSRIPDAVIDPDTGKAMTFQEMLFDGITIIGGAGGNTYFWQDSTSPVDVLRKSSAQIQWAKSYETDGFFTRLWDNAQYRLGTMVGGTVNEASQQLIGRPLSWVRNLVSKKSGEVPFEFLDMDSSILSTLTTNNSRTGRLMQNYAQNILEYTPEVAGNIIEAIILDKGLGAAGEAGQLALQTRLFKIPWMRNSLAGQQLARGISYSIRVGERLGTDQVIDATLSIGDTEPMSDISKKLSRGGTLLGEGIGILSDLKVLGRSFSNYFKPEGFKYGGLTDPIKLMADNPGILDNYAASLGRGTIDESGKIVGDEYKLLLQDLSDYSKYLKILSGDVEAVVAKAIDEGVNLDSINKTFKDATYDVLKQVFKQNSSMSRAITNLVTDSRANIADMVKYIGNIEGVVKIGPFVSTIKIADKSDNILERTVRSYDQKMDLIIEGGIVSGANRGFTIQEVNELVNQGFLKAGPSGSDIGNIIDDYFVGIADGGGTRYFLNSEGLKALNIDTSVVNVPLAIVSMTDDTKELIEKLKSLPEGQKQISDASLDVIGDTDAINRLAENIAGLDYLDICK